MKICILIYRKIKKLKVNEARKITETDEIDQKKEFLDSKSHDEILEMLKDLESFEEKITTPEFREIQLEWQVVEEEIEPEEIKGFFKIHKKIEPGEYEPEVKPRHVFLRRFRKGKSEDQYSKEGEKPEDLEINKEIKPRTTFTLKIDEEGKLVGLPIKKPKPKKEKKSKRRPSFKLRRKGKEEKAEPEEGEEVTEKPPKKRKLKGGLSKIKLPKRKKAEKEE